MAKTRKGKILSGKENRSLAKALVSSGLYEGEDADILDAIGYFSKNASPQQRESIKKFFRNPTEDVDGTTKF